MNHRLFAMLLLFFSIYSCGRKIRPEASYQKCVYNSLSDKGIAYKGFIKGFEEHLISLNILNDSTAKSYHKLYGSIANQEKHPAYYKYSYIDSLNTIEKSKIIPWNKECFKKVTSVTNFKKSKMHTMSKGTDGLKKDSNSLFELIKRELEILKIKDFELEFYKHRVFIFLQMSGHIRQLDSIHNALKNKSQ